MDNAVGAESACPREPPPRERRVGVFGRLLAVLLALACAVLATNNWCFVLIPAGFAALLLDYVICGVKPRLILRLALAATIGVAVGVALRIGPDWAFREAFGTGPPAGIRDVWIQRHYLGGPGEHALIIEFVAEPTAVRTLTSLHVPESQSSRVEQWRAAGSGQSEAWNIFAGPGASSLARSSWMKIQPLKGADIFDYGPVYETGGTLVLFHEPETGRCVALHVRF